jgi:type IX secretion system PorP/SprF family membrane protein
MPSRFSVTVALLLLADAASAQQDPLFGQYINNLVLLNPAHAGYNRDLSGSLAFRKQWAGFDGSPQTTNATIQMALANNKAGVGLMVQDDKIGSSNTTEVQALYAYHLPITKDWVISLGLQGGATDYKTDYGDLVIDPNDPKFTPYQVWRPTFGGGLIVRNERFLLSVSSPDFLNAASDSEMTPIDLNSRNLFVLAAYSAQLTPRLMIKPYALLRQVPSNPLSYDAGVALRVDDSYSLGLYTRSFNTIGLNALLNIGDLLRFGYTFELPTGKSVGMNYTTHEVMLGVRVSALMFHDINVVQNF